ncbi:VOC family protein [Rhizobium terricola]|nr:VOC family protein [Rhizobium terricola]
MTGDSPMIPDDPDLGYDPRKLFHLGYVVPNMERSIKAWTKLGAEILVPPAIDPIQKVSCALLLFRGAAPIELVAPLDATDSPVANRLARGGGLDHICLFTDDLASDLNDLVAGGAQVVAEPSYGAVFDREIAFALTRVGLVVELMTKRRIGKHAVDPLGEATAIWGLNS